MSDWHSVSIPPSSTLGDAIRKIDASAQQVALVIDSERRLIGVITDGDVRRALLRGLGMDAPVAQVLSRNPITLPIGSPRDAQVAEMTRRSIRHLPLLDAEGRVAGLATLAEQLTPLRRPNRVVLMAGGLGSRLAPLTDACPKPMLTVGDKPLLQTILENFAAEGFWRFTLSVNYLAEQIRSHFGDGSAWNVEIEYLHETQRLGTAGALSMLRDRDECSLLVMNADVLTKVSFAQMLEFHEQCQAMATMGVREYEFRVPYGVVMTDAHRIARIDEKPVQRFFVNAGIYVLSPEVPAMIPTATFYDMPTLFASMLARGLDTAAFPVREYWLDIGHLADYHRANCEFSAVFG